MYTNLEASNSQLSQSSTNEDICMVRNIQSKPLENLAICCSTNGTSVNITTDSCWSYCAFPNDQAAWFQQCVEDASGQSSLCIKAGGKNTSAPLHHSGADSVMGIERAKKPMMLGLIVFGLMMFS
jgi:hypothetical protein